MNTIDRRVHGSGDWRIPRTVSMKPWNFFDHFFDFNRGGGFLGIKNSARIGCKSQSGGCDSAISNAVMPSDHRSERLSYVASGFSSQAMTSGAIQYGVPAER